MNRVAVGDAAHDGELIVFDKDGVLADFRAYWGAKTRLRAGFLAEALGQPAAALPIARLLGLADDGFVAPNGLLAIGSRLDSTVVAASFAHQAGMAWHAARAASVAAFARADEELKAEAGEHPIAGAVPAVLALHAAGWKLALATTDDTGAARDFLARCGLLAKFSSVVGVDRVGASKPAPDMIRLACQEVGVPPERALMVGDVAVDMLMGRAAGVKATIAVRSGVGDEVVLAELADHLVDGVWALVPAGSTAPS